MFEDVSRCDVSGCVSIVKICQARQAREGRQMANEVMKLILYLKENVLARQARQRAKEVLKVSVCT